MIKNNIGKVLKKADKSQAWIAGATGISTGMVSQLVSGRSIPTAQELGMLCDALACRAEELYAPDMIALIMGTEKQEQTGGKSYRGKHVLLTDELADDVDAYAARYGLTRNEAARTLIIIGVREEAWRPNISGTITIEEASKVTWEEAMGRVKTDDNADTANPADV